METGIYKITNLLDKNKIYIGRSQINFEKRWSGHIRELNKGTHSNKILNADWIKNGADNFKFEVMHECNPITAKYKELVVIDALKKQGYDLYNVQSLRDNIIFEVAEYIHKLPNFEFEIDNVDDRCRGKKNSLHWQLYIRSGEVEVYVHLYNSNMYLENGIIEELNENIETRKDFILDYEKYIISKELKEVHSSSNCSEIAKDIINEIMFYVNIFG